MTPRRTLLKSATALALLSLAAPVHAAEPTKVVATFSILGDMVQRIGGDHIALTTLVGPGGDTHVYQPTPQAAGAVSKADVLIMNGLEFEGWLERLTESAGFGGALAVATAGLDPIAFDEHDDHHEEGHDDEHHGEDHHDDDHDDDHHKDAHHDDDHAEDGHHDEDEHHDHDKEHDDHEGEGHEDHDDHKDHEDHADHDEHGDAHAHHHHGAFDPHAWQSLTNAVTYVDNITAALAKADPAHAAAFYENRAAYVAEINAAHDEIKTIIATLPETRRNVVTSHDAFQYFGRDYGLTFLAPQGLSTESEASAKGVAQLIEQMRDEGISAVFVENITDPRLLKQIASETGAKIGGTLYPGALSGPDGPAPTYLDMMRHNANTLAQALAE